MSHRFENWSGTVSFTPNTFLRTRIEAEFSEIVSEAAAPCQCSRTQGAAHSFSSIPTTRDTLLKLDRMQPVDVAVNGTHATVLSGMPLKAVINELENRNLRGDLVNHLVTALYSETARCYLLSDAQ